jgi:hypothetical protein
VSDAPFTKGVPQPQNPGIYEQISRKAKLFHIVWFFANKFAVDRPEGMTKTVSRPVTLFGRQAQDRALEELNSRAPAQNRSKVAEIDLRSL